jgi:hypothetical protein
MRMHLAILPCYGLGRGMPTYKERIASCPEGQETLVREYLKAA